MFSFRRHIHGLFRSTYQPSCHASLRPSRTYLPPCLRSLFRPEGKLRYEAEEELPKEQDLRALADKFKKYSVSPWFRQKRSFYDTTFRRLTIAKRFDLIEEILEDQKKYWNMSEEPFACRIILLYGKAGMINHALNLFNEMPQLNCQRSSRTFNTLLTACLEAKTYHTLLEIFRDVPKKLCIKRGVIPYNCLVKAHCEMGNMDSAVNAVDDMEFNGVDPDVNTYAILLEGYYRKNMLSDAENVWKTLKRKGMEPSIRCYSSKIQSLVRAKRITEATEVFKVMKGKGIEPDSYTFCYLVAGYCREKKYEEAKSLYQEQEELKIFPRDAIFWNLIPLAVEMDDLDFALQVTKKATGSWCRLKKSIFKGLVDLLVKDARSLDLSNLGDFLKRCNGYYEYEPEWFMIEDVDGHDNDVEEQ